MDRRDFITVVGAGAAACMAGAAAQVAAPPQPVAPAFELEEATLASVREGLNSGRWTSQSLTDAYLKRIAQLNRTGPSLCAVIEVNPDAMKIAKALDDAPVEGLRGPLHGVPVLLKDNIDTHDSMTTTAGSLALEGMKPSRDSAVAQKLRAAGAVILGKANLSEWANFRSSLSTSGWSARGGQCRNPYVLDRSPLGSSSGSGTAVAANMCAVAVGTETDGSITAPASVCCLVGIKPTVGLVSRSGIVPISHTQDTAGPMCRCVADAAILLSALAGPDMLDTATAESLSHQADYAASLNADGLKGARIGVARKLCGFHPAADRVLEDALGIMKERGAVIVELPDFFDVGSVGDSEMDVLLYEFKADLNAYLRKQPGRYQALTLEKLIAFNEANKAREMPFFGQEIFIKAQACGPLTDARYLKALEHNQRKTRAEGIDAVMAKHNLDAITAPTCAPAGVIDQVNGDKYLGSTTTPAAVAGYPHITVPGGWDGELPIGLSFFGKAWSEPTLIKLAYAYEQATKHRRPPKLLPSLAMR